MPCCLIYRSEEVLFEADSENDTETSDQSIDRDRKSSAVQSVERQRSDPSPTADKFCKHLSQNSQHSK